ncbi:MAG TPA: glycoside hydrolase family 3 N-terminal domain-containing protein [Candidatus Limnocylindrales bacterium]|nr:glycoside hydrolase family 3 N-terminal domain-containing protein [Candidatus Limnocylindrales bacterium]
MSTSPPARSRRRSLVLAGSLIVFLGGLAFFVGTRFARTAGEPAPSPSGVALASPTAPLSPTPSPSATPEPTPTPTPAPPLEQVIGQKLVIRMEGLTPSKALLERVRRGEVGGIVLFGFNVRDQEQVFTTTTRLQEAAAEGGQPPLLIMADQEGGGVRRIPWSQPVASATRMGSMEPDEVRSIGASAGKSLAASGINVDLAPVADVPDDRQSFMRDSFRTFSSDPDVVASLVTAFSDGLASQDVLAVVKHFPGIGRVAKNTDRFVETVRESRDELRADLTPFRAAIDGGVPIVMLSNATYRALDPDNAAGWSKAIATDLLRGELGFTGVSITDSLSGTAHAREVSARSLAAKAANAGTDMVMITGTEKSTAAAYEALLEQARAGAIDRTTLDASYERILALKATLAR